MNLTCLMLAYLCFQWPSMTQWQLSFRQEYQVEAIGIPHRGPSKSKDHLVPLSSAFSKLGHTGCLPHHIMTLNPCSMPNAERTQNTAQALQTEFASSRSLWSNSSSDTSSSLFSLSVFLEIKHQLRATVSAHHYKHMRKVYQCSRNACWRPWCFPSWNLQGNAPPCATWTIEYTLRIRAKLSRPHHRHHHQHHSGHRMIDYQLKNSSEDQN